MGARDILFNSTAIAFIMQYVILNGSELLELQDTAVLSSLVSVVCHSR